MSVTSINSNFSSVSKKAGIHFSTKFTHNTNIRKRNGPRYSDFALLSLEGHHKIDPEQEKAKLLDKRAEMIQEFKEKYLP